MNNGALSGAVLISSGRLPFDLEPDLPDDAFADPDAGPVRLGLGQELHAGLFQRLLNPHADL